MSLHFSLWKIRFHKAGFTLAELLIVVGLLILLAFIALMANVTHSFKSARDSNRKQDLSKLVRYMEDYYNDHGRYPPGDADGYIAGIPWGQEFTPYGSNLPRDPLTPNQSYFYQTDPALQNFFAFYAKLENTNDPDIDKSGCHFGCGPNSAYNFIVHSPNVLLAGGLPYVPIGGNNGEEGEGGEGGEGGGGGGSPSPTPGPTVTLGPSPTSQPTPTPMTPPGSCGFDQCCPNKWCGGGAGDPGAIRCNWLDKCYYDTEAGGWLCICSSKCGAFWCSE